MKSIVKQRLMKFAEFRNLSISKFESLCGLGNGYVGKLKGEPGSRKLEDILKAFPELNREWLLFGEGEMLKASTPAVMQNNVNGDNNYTAGNNNYVLGGRANTMGAVEEPEVEEITDSPVEYGAPIIPSALVRQPNIDILVEMKKAKKAKKVEYSAVRAPHIKKAFWYRVTDHSMEPKYEPGDELALWPYEIGNERVIPGKTYAIDTNSNGLIVGILFPEGDSFRVHPKNSVEFPDFIIDREDIVRIYRIMLMIRQ